jgi:hypothetical protein
LGGVGHFEGGGVFLIAVIDKIDFDKGHMQIDPFVGAIVVYSGDTAAGNFQFYFFSPGCGKTGCPATAAGNRSCDAVYRVR